MQQDGDKICENTIKAAQEIFITCNVLLHGGVFCFLKYLSEKVYLSLFMYSKHQEEYPKLGLMGLLKTSLLYKCT